MPPFDRTWALFLDRDGVLNVEKTGGYILSWEEFVFLPGVLEAMAILSGVFGPIVVVTNQRGVGRGLMSAEDLEEIHQRMRAAITAHGGRIDAIYACTDADPLSPCRKPNPGLAYRALEDFPQLEWQRCVMVGNSDSDMEFGRGLGMYTVWIATKQPAPSRAGMADEVFPSLLEWALTLRRR